MIGSISRIKSQQGFSMAEVVVAVVLFVASIVGVSVMLVSGGQNVTRGAKESAAANLAQKKVEEVKSLPFYRSWDGTNHDIDDFYWAYNGGTPRTNAEQRANPVVEDYGSIPGYSSYKRTTAVTYKYLDGSNQLADAAMDPNWRPKAPTSAQYDRPTGGAAGGPYTTLHAVEIEVKVYYRTDAGAEKQYSAQGLAGDLMVTGGVNTPLMIINSITPTYGFYMNDTNLQVTVYVQTPPGTLNASSSLDVFLWYPGCSDIHATGESANAAGTTITSYFDLRPANGARVGMYNLSVTWIDRGFVASFRDNVFEVKAPPPVFGGISNYNWGYRGQTARQITITGNDLWESTVRLKGPDGGNNYIDGGAVTSGDGHTVTATFNLSGNSTDRPNNTHWDVVVTASGGVIQTTPAQRFWLNPPPVFTRVSATNAGNWYDWAWKTQTVRRVRLEGQYLYGFDSSAYRYATMSWSTMTSANATLISGPNGNSCNDTDPVILQFNPSSGVGDCTGGNAHGEVANTRWNVNILGNCGGNVSSTGDIQRILMNPAPQITSISGLVGGYRKTGNVSTITINGNYFQDSVGFYLINNGGNSPSGPNQTCIIGMGGTTNLDGTQITGITENLDKSAFCDWGNGWAQLAGTSAALNSTSYTTLLQNGNYDWGSVWNTANVTISHAPIALNYAAYTVGYNQWDISIAASGAWLYPGETSVALYSTAGDYTAANPSSVATLSNYSTSGYGSAQTISGCQANAISLPTGSYKIKVQDTENGHWAATQSDLTCAYQAPTGTMTDARQGTNIGLGTGGGGSSGWPNYTGGPRVGIGSTISGMRGLYNVTSVTWSSQMYHASPGSCGVFCGSMSWPYDGAYTTTATGVTLNANRAAETLTVTYTVSMLRRFYAYHWDLHCCLFNACRCQYDGLIYLDYKSGAAGGGDCNNITLNGGWGSTVKSAPNISY